MNRDLDKQIAELKGCNTKLEESTKQWYCNCEHQIHGDSKYDYTPPYLKLYSSKIEDAFPLFEEMGLACLRKYSDEFKKQILKQGLKFDKKNDYGCSYAELGEVFFGKTASEAICKAWIKWKEFNGIECKKL